MSGFVLKMRIWIKTPRQVSIYKIVSGTFERNKPYYRTSKKRTKFSSPNAFCRKKEIVDISYGDIVGLHDTGNFKIGDTLTEGEIMSFKGIPSFSPDILDTSIMLIQ
jgi:peptide chain release factor 3